MSKKCLAEFAAAAANKVKSIFGRGVYLDENTSQAASVRVVRRRRTRSACSRLQKPVEKPRGGIFDSLKRHPFGRLFSQAPPHIARKPPLRVQWGFLNLGKEVESMVKSLGIALQLVWY